MTQDAGSAIAIAIYEERSAQLAARYDAIPNDTLYAPVRHLIPTHACRIADIGAATGRDARWFADMGHMVTAVEPTTGFLHHARQSDSRIDWLCDALPDLPLLLARGGEFDFINIMGVWQHLDTGERARAAPVLRRLLAPGGLLCLALRIGPLPPGMPVHEIDPSATSELFASAGFEEVFRASSQSIQEGNRAAGVHWVWLVMLAGERHDT